MTKALEKLFKTTIRASLEYFFFKNQFTFKAKIFFLKINTCDIPNCHLCD